MKYILSKHAKEQLGIRNISEGQLTAILENPDKIIVEQMCKHTYQKMIIDNDKQYLYRIFANVCKEPMLIITGYRTSKIEKYEN